jgi:DNA-binding NarL/FixJ family response regulator
VAIALAKTDVVLMDINLDSNESGIDCVRVLKPKIPDTNFMMCTVYEENEKIFESIKRRRQRLYSEKTTDPARNAGVPSVNYMKAAHH